MGIMGFFEAACRMGCFSRLWRIIWTEWSGAMKERKRFSWLWAWLIQIFGFLILNSLVINAAPYLGPAMGAVECRLQRDVEPVNGLR